MLKPNVDTKNILSNNSFVLTVILVMMIIGLSLGTNHFATPANFAVILQTMTLNGILAIGLTFCILTAGIDLSVGSVLSLSGIVLAMALRDGLNPGTAIFLALLCGMLCGLVNGLLVSMFKLPAFIATLGMQSIAMGIALTLTLGHPITGVFGSLRFIGTYRVLNNLVPVQFLIMLGCFLVAFFILKFTRLGRYMYLIGGNAEAAKFAGVNMKVYTAAPFVLSGMLAAIAAIIMTARLNSAEAVAGVGLELDAVAAAIIGGTSMRGGEGTMLGTFLGALLMAVIRNGMVQMGLGPHPQRITIGAIIIVVVMIDMINRNRTGN